MDITEKLKEHLKQCEWGYIETICLILEYKYKRFYIEIREGIIFPYIKIDRLSYSGDNVNDLINHLTKKYNLTEIKIQGRSEEEFRKVLQDAENLFTDNLFGDTIRLRRKELNKNLKEIADACSISISMLSDLEHHYQYPTSELKQKLFEVLEINEETK